MTNLSPDQRDRAKTLLKNKRHRNELFLSDYEESGVERDLSSFFNGIAGRYQSIGVLEIAVGDFETARDAFTSATEYYKRSAEEDVFPLHSTRQRLQGMYTALLAANEDDLVVLAESVITLTESEACSPGEDNADRYFLAWCLAGTVLEDVDDAALAGLETVNESKPGQHADYGHAILSLARGMRSGDVTTIQTAIESMLSFHDQDSHQDNVVDQVMSVQATALVVLARARGYDITVDSPFFPDEFVEETVSMVSL